MELAASILLSGGWKSTLVLYHARTSELVTKNEIKQKAHGDDGLPVKVGNIENALLHYTILFCM
jgi:hypothetical protein